jgi:hypothetical protein
MINGLKLKENLYDILANRVLLDEPELTEVSIRQRGPRYPEFTLYLGTKAKEQGGNTLQTTHV